MNASKFSDAQKAFIFKRGADGVPVADICRKAGISQAPYFNWKKKYDGLLPTEMRRLKLLEDENAKLRRSSLIYRSTARCFRTSSAENFKACSEA
jgi:putative transposase